MAMADEPFASLDPHNAAKVMRSLKAINEEDGIPAICNLHHLNTAKSNCRRIIGMAMDESSSRWEPKSTHHGGNTKGLWSRWRKQRGAKGA